MSHYPWEQVLVNVGIWIPMSLTLLSKDVTWWDWQWWVIFLGVVGMIVNTERLQC